MRLLTLPAVQQVIDQDGQSNKLTSKYSVGGGGKFDNIINIAKYIVEYWKDR
ncbi:hypothetical protein M1146_05280 [Patescibacteria group bacterium]|nr:hypothetical protein [Patescibacteria group bacterium]